MDSVLPDAVSVPDGRRPHDSFVADSLLRVLAGEQPGRRDATDLYLEAETKDLLAAASALRERGKGRDISYSRKVFIPLTHLCRDYCGYCTFRADPKPGAAHYMTPDEVLAIAEAGKRAGCKEALFSLGDQPEKIFPEAREALARFGYTRTLDYLAAMSRLVLEEAGLLPHSNPGIMSADDLRMLRETNVSLGLMLESTSTRLSRKGAAHWRAPDKAPRFRLRVIEEAGRQKIAFTTGMLIGIGENWQERLDTLFAIRALHERHGHIQEVLVQPFRAKRGTRMENASAPVREELQRTIAIARLILGSEINLQSPPNLMAEDYAALLDAGINDWGGISPVTQDFINPEAAWPQIAMLTTRTREAGFTLRERLAIHPEFARKTGFVADGLKPHLERHLAHDGYALIH